MEWKQALWFDLKFPAGPKLSESLIGSCNSALIWLGQSMGCSCTSCDCAAIGVEVIKLLVSSVAWKYTVYVHLLYTSTAGCCPVALVTHWAPAAVSCLITSFQCLYWPCVLKKLSRMELPRKSRTSHLYKWHGVLYIDFEMKMSSPLLLWLVHYPPLFFA